MFFRQAGLFVAPDFLNGEFVERVRREMLTAPREKGLVVTSDGQDHLDENIRKVESGIVPHETRVSVRQGLRGLMPDLEKHFNVELTDCESPHYLIYRPGDFFARHSDGGERGNNEDTRKRRVSAVIFLNRESREPTEETYGGGRLTFYGLLDGLQWERCGIPLSAEPGLLVAFRSETLHEVTPVSHGQRLSVVAWYYAP
jgi:SM-20-related protein